MMKKPHTQSRNPIIMAATVLGGALAMSLSPVSADTLMDDSHIVESAALTEAFETANTCRDFDPIARYGNELLFQIRRNDAPVGRHSVQFNRGRDGLQVVAQSNIDISFLGFSAYSFSYRSESVWQGGALAALSVVVDDDGEETIVEAKRSDNNLIVTGPEGEQVLPANIFPTDHWHCGVLGSSEVLNTITGKPNDVVITAKPGQMLRTTNDTLRATEFAYDGELETNAWYDAQGRWVGLQFSARDGSDITYRCMNCATETAQKDPE